jgi:hypothetical protein
VPIELFFGDVSKLIDSKQMPQSPAMHLRPRTGNEMSPTHFLPGPPLKAFGLHQEFKR